MNKGWGNTDGLTEKCEVIVRILKRSPGRFVQTARIVAEVYADAPDGGPMDTRTAINRIIRYNRDKLARCGLRIEARIGRDGGYRIYTIGGD